jgi:hypothetical protein
MPGIPDESPQSILASLPRPGILKNKTRFAIDEDTAVADFHGMSMIEMNDQQTDGE